MRKGIRHEGSSQRRVPHLLLKAEGGYRTWLGDLWFKQGPTSGLRVGPLNIG